MYHINKHRLIHNVNHSDLSDKTIYKQLNDNTYEVQRNTFFRGNQFSAGFKIRIENISVDLLGEAKQLIQLNAKDDYQLIYYHLDSSFLKQYEIQQLR